MNVTPLKPAPGATDPAQHPDGVELCSADDVPIVPVRWLWRPWLARGKLHLLAGAPGQGKTSLALALAATISRGATWPDGQQSEPANVLVWSGEDDFADTLNPRLAAMGADRSRILFVGDIHQRGKRRPFNPAHDVPALTKAAMDRGGVAFVIIDPLMSAVSGESNNGADVRRSLEPIARMAQTLDAAVLGIHHFSKGTAGRSPLDRITGSLAFGAVVRVALAVASVKNSDGSTSRILAMAKSNIGRDDLAFEYHLDSHELEPGIDCPVISWGRQLQGDASDLLSDAPEASESGSALDDAKQWLRAYLTCSTPANTVFVEAANAGHSNASIKRASGLLGVKKTKGIGGASYWQLAQLSPP